MKTLSFICLFSILMACNSTKKISDKILLSKKSYYQKWVGGLEKTGSGVTLHLFFTHSLPKNVTLRKVHLLNYQSEQITKENEQYYTVHIKTKAHKYNLDDITTTKQPMEDGTAVLFFTTSTGTFSKTFTAISEKSTLAYPAIK